MPTRGRAVAARWVSSWILAVLCLVGLAVRSLPLTLSHEWDETVYLQNAKGIGEGRENYSELYYRPPLLSVFYAAGFWIWDDVYVANLVQGLLTALIIPFGYLLTRRISGERAGVLAATAFALSPSLVDQSHQLLSGNPALSFSMACLALLVHRSSASLFLSGHASRFAVAIVASARQVVSTLRRGRRDDRALEESVRHQIVLALWALLFFGYALTITHKEPRYLLPLALAVIPLGAIGLDRLLESLRGRPRAVRGATLAALAVAATVEAQPTLARLGDPLVDDRRSEPVRVALYLAQNAGSQDTIYAVTAFPVLAFYSGMRTVSLLPVQAELPERWRERMPDPGFYVYFQEDGPRGLQPSLELLESAPEFERWREFESAIVFRYRPAR